MENSFTEIKIYSWIKVTLFLSLNREEWISFLETSTTAFFFLFYFYFTVRNDAAVEQLLSSE